MDKLLKDVIEIAKRAGDKTLKIYKKDYKVYKKEDGSPVTEADLASGKVILSGLKKYNYPILTEEKKDDKSRLKSKTLWIVDPLDGTNDFLDKTGQFSIMIGLVRNKKPVLGVIYQPTEQKLYFAQKEKGAFLKEKNNSAKRLNVSDINQLPKTRFVVSRTHFSKKVKNFLQKNNIKNTTKVGSIGIKIGLLTESKADAYITFTNKTCQWDSCAPQIILEQAGGKMTDLTGKNFSYNRPELKNLNGIIASNGKIHNLIVQRL